MPMPLETLKHVGLVAAIAAVLLIALITGRLGGGSSSAAADGAERPASYWIWILTAGGLALGWAVMTGRVQLP
ncbi:MAG TPA: hypothetical protein VGS12_13390 [Caulobacteraceae bacterium]|nr:hypothetical protein [Caulobacteraceae bacterium]